MSVDRERIERTHRMAMATRPTELDSWLNAYRDDVGELLAALAAAEAENARLAAATRAAYSRLILARASMRAGLRHDDYDQLRAWLLAESENGWIREVSDALASRLGEGTACERCHGDGVVTVGGTSVNPRTGVLGPDPQADEDVRCPDCGGTGIAHPSGESAASDARKSSA